MSRSAAPIVDAVRLGAARWRHGLGWPGVAGLACALLALTLVWQDQAVPQPAPVLAEPVARAPAMPAPTPPTPPVLPQRADVAALLSQIEQQAKAQGLAWPQAEYRLTALTPERLGELEVGFTLVGGYPPVRAFLNGLLDAQPALALRELSLRRPHSDAAEVEARIVLVVFLRDGWPHAQAWAPPRPAEEGATP